MESKSCCVPRSWVKAIIFPLVNIGFLFREQQSSNFNKLLFILFFITFETSFFFNETEDLQNELWLPSSLCYQLKLVLHITNVNFAFPNWLKLVSSIQAKQRNTGGKKENDSMLTSGRNYVSMPPFLSTWTCKTVIIRIGIPEIAVPQTNP